MSEPVEARGDEGEGPLRITPEEVAAAVPPAPRLARPAPPPPAPAGPRLSQLAVASFVTAALGVPLPGLLLGPIAVLLGALALASIHARADRRGTRLAVAGLLLGVLDLAGWGVAVFVMLGRTVDPGQRPPTPTLLSAPAAPVDVDEAPPAIRRALRANVTVESEGALSSAQGSGVLVARTGERLLVLTNRHVVCGGEDAPGRVRVRLSDGQRADARVAWLAPDGVDAAIVEARGLVGGRVAPVRMSRAATARIGDAAFAIGNPLSYEGTYTTGVISSIRALRAGTRSLRVYQTQAPVNPGNSGGGLYTAQGELIGVNTWTTAKETSEGLGFAIAVDGILELLGAEEHALLRELAATPGAGDGPEEGGER